MPCSILAAASFGLAIGSFLNVVIYRLPLGQSLRDAAVALPQLRLLAALVSTTFRS